MIDNLKIEGERTMTILWIILWHGVLSTICYAIVNENKLRTDMSTIQPYLGYNDLKKMLDGVYESTSSWDIDIDTENQELMYKGMQYAYNIYKQGIRVEPEGCLQTTADYGENAYKYPDHPFKHPVYKFNDRCVQYNWQCMFDVVLADLDIIKYQEQASNVVNATNSKLLAQANH